MRSRVAHLGTLCLCVLAACTTSLSYKFDAGAEGGTPPDGAPSDGGVLPDGAPAACSATAQFCDDFEAATKWGTLEWNILDRTFGPGNGSGFTANRVPRGIGYGLELLGKPGAGGFAFPAKAFQRRGPDKRLSIVFTIAFLDAKDGTILELGPQDKPETVRLSMKGNGNRLYVDDVDTQHDLPITGTSPVKLEVVVVELTGTQHIQIPTIDLSQSIPATFPTDAVEVRFAVTPPPPATQLAGPMKVVIDDIVID